MASGDDEFLVLLFVLQAKLQEVFDFSRSGAIPQQGEDSVVDVRTIIQNLAQTGAGEQATLGAGEFLADAVVIGIEQHAIRGVERFETGFEPFQNEGFEKPAGMRQMPFNRAGIRHGLHLAVFLR